MTPTKNLQAQNIKEVKMVKIIRPDSEKMLTAAVRQELLFLANENLDNIRYQKILTHAVLLFYTAAFVGVWCLHDADPFALSALFIVGGFVTSVVCAFFFPDRIYESRRRLRRIYHRLGAKFKEAYGNIEDAGKNDSGDWMYMLFAFLYPLCLVAVYIIHQWGMIFSF